MSSTLRVAVTRRSIDAWEERMPRMLREAVAAYLNAGTAILYTTAKTADRLDPDRGEVVPLSVRSDGEWVWSDAHAYFAEVHGLAPEAALLEHIRSRDYTCRVLDADEAERVLEAFAAAGSED
jgi:hypothetical protein